VLAFLPDLQRIGAISPASDGIFRAHPESGASSGYKLCHNHASHHQCNWAVRAADDHALCESCRLTVVATAPSTESGRRAWSHAEAAKRRLLLDLKSLKLPITGRDEDAIGGLVFELLGERRRPGLPHGPAEPDQGVISAVH